MRLLAGWRYEKDGRRFVYFVDGWRVTGLPARLFEDEPRRRWPAALRDCREAPRRPPAKRMRRSGRSRLAALIAPSMLIDGVDITAFMASFAIPARMLGNGR